MRDIFIQTNQGEKMNDQDRFKYDFAKSFYPNPFTIMDKDGNILKEPTAFVNRPENVEKIDSYVKKSMNLEMLYGYTYEYLSTLSIAQLEALYDQEEQAFKERTN